MMYLGLDIGKRWHEAALIDADGDVVRQLRFAPTRAGLTALTEWLGDLAPTAVQVGLEATGVYWLTVHAWLQQWGAARIRVLNPLQTRAFRNANLRGVKSDRVDAVSIARLLRWEGARLATHTVPADRQAAAREIARLPTEMIELRARPLTKPGTVLEPLFPEFAAAFSDLGSPSALAVLTRWPAPATLAQARASDLTRVSRTDPQCQAIYTAQRAKGKHHTVAVSHVAHQLLHIAYSVLLHARPYTVPARFTAAATTPQLAEAGT